MDRERMSKEFEELQRENEWLERLNERLEKMVARQDKQIIELQGKIEALDYDIGKLTETVDKKDDLIQFFKIEMEKRSDEYYTRLEAKGSEIMQLNAALRMEREKWINR